MSLAVRNNESGIVSIMVTMILMIVISLIVIGFSQVTRRNQRETLDRQLSTQAFYAAETGVNDVITALKNGPPTTFPLQTTYAKNCDGPNSFINFIHSNNSGISNFIGPNVGYTCLLVNDTPPSVVVNVQLGSSRVVPLLMNMANNGSLTISWKANTLSGADVLHCPSGGNAIDAFTPYDVWNQPGAACPFGLLRFDLYADSGTYDAQTMANNSVAVYMVPARTKSPSNNISFGNPSQSVYVRNVKCTNAACTGTITGLKPFVASYYMRLSSIYQNLGDVTITGAPGTTFAGAAIVIDSTGQAQDQLRRIQVRIPLVDNSGIKVPVNSLQSVGAICKRFEIAGSGSPAAPDFNDPSNPLCRPF
jgi:hypothetical protein